MNIKHCLFILPVFASVALAQDLPNAPSAQKSITQKIAADSGWPRTFKSGGEEFVVYQPQVDKWENNRIHLYSAVELRTGPKATPKYGVVWFSARTEVDKVNRLVTLDDADVTNISFPLGKAEEQRVFKQLKAKLPGRTRTISLDRLESGVRAAAPEFEGIEVKNDPPRILFSNQQALLINIDGQPKLVEVENSELQRIVNTNAVLLFEPGTKQYFLRVSDWWMQSPDLNGTWVRSSSLPGDMKKAEETFVAQDKEQQSRGSEKEQSVVTTKTKASLKESVDAPVPSVFVVYAPTELVDTEGEPRYKQIAGTSVEYVENTKATVLRTHGSLYLLVSGRWFTSSSFEGEWTFVDKGNIPADFSKIPADSPMAKVLVSIPDTPQAQEALIANSIPQTATITRSEAKLTVVYDGEPMFVPLEGTSMTYGRNTSAAVIKVADHKYYAVESGVWFTGPTPQGPWRVAESVPNEIYTIPPSSSLHYVTYARVYGYTPNVVYVGYTPGYYGTVVSANTMTVVYGTGWYYPPYIGPTVWHGNPYTYGVGAGFAWTEDAGWGLSFGVSYGYYYPYYYPWWGPMGYYGCCWYPYYGWGAWGGAAVANVYGRWGNTAYSRTAAAWANPYTGNYGAASRGGTYNSATGRVSAAGRGYNTNIYTGNTYGYRGAATYNPDTGIVAGAGAGFAGNRYTGEGTGGRGGFVYNTNTGAGIAAGKNNIYAGKDGTVYRYDRQNGSWSQNSGNGWQAAERPGNGSGNVPTLQRQQEARTQGTQRTQNFNSMRNSGFNRGSFRSAPRMGGRRR